MSAPLRTVNLIHSGFTITENEGVVIEVTPEHFIVAISRVNRRVDMSRPPVVIEKKFSFATGREIVRRGLCIMDSSWYVSREPGYLQRLQTELPLTTPEDVLRNRATAGSVSQEDRLAELTKKYEGTNIHV